MTMTTMTAMTPTNRTWWKEAVVYQIYPASFLDTNGDGLGDVPGVLAKVPYLKGLGVDAVWLSPIYKSPQRDMGYDVSDYRAIHAPYGSLADVDALIAELHAHGLRLLMDLVVNHTSDEHAWFVESRSSRSNPKRDWYFWRDARHDADGNRTEPNNWRSIFGGSAWHWDDHTGQYYLALFLPSQPDLNWECAAMREATYADMAFWLDRGVDGFRVDSMNLMSKHPGLPDAVVTSPGKKYQSGHEWFASMPRMHDHIKEMRAKVWDKYDDIVAVGELGFTKDEESVRAYVARDRCELDMVFTGDIVDIGFGPGGKYTRGEFHPRLVREITDRWQLAMPRFDGWNTAYLDNHDSGRSLSRYASDRPEHRAMAAKMLATYLLTLAGTPFMLAGQEIGMANLGEAYGVDAYIDVEGRNYYNEVLKARGGDDSKMEDVMKELRLKARDHGRLPMQWDASMNAGFSTGTPWMTVNGDYVEWNVENQLGDEGSVLGYWRRMLGLRKEYTDLFVYGEYVPLDEETTGEEVLGWRRKDGQGREAVVLLNFSGEEKKVAVPGTERYSVLVSNQEGGVEEGTVALIPYGAVVLVGS